MKSETKVSYKVGDVVVTIKELYAVNPSGRDCLAPVGTLGTVIEANPEADHYVVSYSNYRINVPYPTSQITKVTKLHKALQ